MSETRYDIVFRGDLVLGQNIVEVKARLQKLFKADAARIDALFSGRPVTLKRNLDQAAAQKYRQVLEQAGIQVQVKAQSEPSAPAQAAAKAPVAPAASPATTDGWDLAPVGELLRPEERPRLQPVHVDTSAISLKPQTGNLVDAEELPMNDLPPPVIPELDIAEPGSDVLRPEERAPEPEATVMAGDWDIAEVGEDVLKPEERQKVEPVEVDISGISLAD
ncbi:hypothetical protein [Marinimicrobium alkaliphilum]|uniref:hypothetical protein n=1 Tax=Marinimicrobium alkaliphilum TaxID=2202654 RepID=UPI000DBA2D03|nr:hypothetical protein [Marinimicrobium alkaliphilum]